MNWCSKANFLISSAAWAWQRQGHWVAGSGMQTGSCRWRRNVKDKRRNGNKRGLFDQKSFEGNPSRPVGHAAAKMINDGPDSWHIRLLIFQYIKRIRSSSSRQDVNGIIWQQWEFIAPSETLESWLSIKRKHQLNTKGDVYTSFHEATPPVFKLNLSNQKWRNKTLPYKCRSICLTRNKNPLFTVTQIVLIGSWSQLPVTAAK